MQRLNNVFEAATYAEKWIKDNTAHTVVQTTGVVGVSPNGQVLKFRDSYTAINAVNGNGYVFSYIYRDSNLELRPE